MIDHDLFRAVLGRFASGVTVVTTVDARGIAHGMTVSAFSSVSLDPPLVLVCIGKDATLAPVLHECTGLAINFLADDQEALSRRFASELPDRFADVEHHRAPGGCPVLGGVLAWMECRIVARHPAGDHTIVIGEVNHAAVNDGRPLLYYRGGYAQLER